MKKEVTFTVKGVEWTAKFLTEKQFDKAYLKSFPDEDEATEYGFHGNKTIYFCSNLVDRNTIRHEVFHSFVTETNTDFVDFGKSEMEDLSCDIFAEHCLDILKVCDKVLDAFLSKE